MNKISLRIYPDEVLRTVCSEISNIDSNIEKIVESMKEIMIKEKGIGLAGPQVGLTKRLFITQDFSKNDTLDFLVMINPKIKEKFGEVSSKEGCLSIPGYYRLPCLFTVLIVLAAIKTLIFSPNVSLIKVTGLKFTLNFLFVLLLA